MGTFTEKVPFLSAPSTEVDGNGDDVGESGYRAAIAVIGRKTPQ